MDDIKLARIICTALVIGVLGAVATVAGCVSYEKRLVTEAVLNGADPIAARCAISADNYHVCIIKAAKE